MDTVLSMYSTSALLEDAGILLPWCLPVEEDGVCQLGEGLHGGAVAAPEAVQGGAPAARAATLALQNTFEDYATSSKNLKL